MLNDQPATKQDLLDLERDLKRFIVEREVTSIRWFVSTFIGAQIAYFAITVTAVWFMLTHFVKVRTNVNFRKGMEFQAQPK